jgi:hypothetical protein
MKSKRKTPKKFVTGTIQGQFHIKILTHNSCQYLREFLNKFKTALIEYPGWAQNVEKFFTTRTSTLGRE